MFSLNNVGATYSATSKNTAIKTPRKKECVKLPRTQGAESTMFK